MRRAILAAILPVVACASAPAPLPISPAGYQACKDYGIGGPGDWRAQTCNREALAEIAQWRAENPRWDMPAERVREALERTLSAQPTCGELNLAVAVMVAAGGAEDDVPERAAPAGGCRAQ